MNDQAKIDALVDDLADDLREIVTEIQNHYGRYIKAGANHAGVNNALNLSI